MSDAISAIDDQLSQRFIALDPSGYFLIRVDASAAELVVEHYLNDIDAVSYTHLTLPTRLLV